MVFDLSLRNIRDGKATRVREFSCLTTEQSTRLAKALKTNKTLTHLDLKNADLSNEGVEHLADALKLNSTLTKVRLISTKIGDRGASFLGEALAVNTTLLNLLLLVGNGIGDDGVGLLAKGLESNCTLVTLALSHTKTGDAGAAHLSRLLRNNNTIQKLGLSHTLVGDKGAMHLSRALKTNVSVLESLYLRNTRIGDLGAKHLGEALKVNHFLVKLYLSYTNIGDLGAGYLANGLTQNKSLDMLFLNNTKIADGGAGHLAKALAQNESLVILNLANTLIGDKGAKYLASGLKRNRSLVRLSLHESAVGNVGAKYLVEALKWNQSLTRLFLSMKQIGMDELRECQESLERNKNAKKNRFLETLNSNEKAPWNRTRIMFIGHAKGGKTATIRSLLGMRFEPKYVTSVGASLTEYKRRIEHNHWSKLKKPKTKQQMRYSSRHAALIMIKKSSKPKPNLFNRIFGKRTNKLRVLHSSPTFADSRIVRIESENRDVNTPFLQSSPEADDLLLEGRHESQINTRQSVEFGSLYDDDHVFGDVNEGIEKPVLNNPLDHDIPEDAGELDPVVVDENWSNYDEFVPALQQHPRDGRVNSPSSGLGDNSKHSIFQKFYERLLVEARHDFHCLNLNLWDISGQDTFDSVHQLFVTNTGVYVLVFNIADFSENEGKKSALQYFSYWISSVRIHSPASPLALVGTRCDGSESRDLYQNVELFIEESILGEYGGIVRNDADGLSFFPVDNETGSGVENLRSVLGQVARVEASAREVPIRWLAFLDEIIHNQDQRPFLRLTEIKSIGLQIGMERAEQEEAMELFHEYGLLCHLRMTEALKSFVVLNPQWLLDSLSKVLSAETRQSLNVMELDKFGLSEDVSRTYNKALASRDFLEYVWGEEEIDYLMDVMKYTMLMSDWNFSSEKYYLIPSLLQDDEAVTNNDMRTGWICCIFDFSLSFLPKGVFQRLICLCITQCGLCQAEDKIPEPMLSKNNGVIHFAEGYTVHLRQNEAESCLYMYVDNKDYAVEMFAYIRSMITRLNSSIMGGWLAYDVFLEDPTSGEMMTYDEVITHEVEPWFSQMSEVRQGFDIDVDSFIENVFE